MYKSTFLELVQEVDLLEFTTFNPKKISASDCSILISSNRALHDPPICKT